MKARDYLYMLPFTRDIIFEHVDRKRISMEKVTKPEPINFGGGGYWEKDIYLIRWTNPKAGLFAYVLNILGELWYAALHGYEPVIDMQSTKNTYLEDYQIGTVNSWEYYFEQIGQLSVDDCKKYKNVFVSSGKGQFFSPCPSVGWMNNKNKIKLWQDFTRDNLILKPNVLAYCEKSAENLFSKNSRILGVKCRGTDYNQISAKGHPIQPDVEEVIAKSKRLIEKYKMDKVYLSTEDKTFIDKFRGEFGSMLLISESCRVDYDINKQSCVSLYSTGRKDDKYIQGMEYLRDIYLLSKCQCLIGGINGGSAGALIMGNNYEYSYFWYKGRY